MNTEEMILKDIIKKNNEEIEKLKKTINELIDNYKNEVKKEEVIKYIQECEKCEFYDIFDKVRERHNDAMRRM